MKHLVYGCRGWIPTTGSRETADSDNPDAMLRSHMTPLSRVAIFVVLLAGAFALAAPVEGNAAIVEVAFTGTLAGTMVAFVLPWAYASSDTDRTPPATKE